MTCEAEGAETLLFHIPSHIDNHRYQGTAEGPQGFGKEGSDSGWEGNGLEPSPKRSWTTKPKTRKNHFHSLKLTSNKLASWLIFSQNFWFGEGISNQRSPSLIAFPLIFERYFLPSWCGDHLYGVYDLAAQELKLITIHSYLISFQI